MSPWNIKTIYRTLRQEFPHVLVFAAEDLSSDTILIASPRPITIDRARIERLLANARTGAEARRAGFESAHDVPAQLLLTADEVEAFTAGAAVNTDDNARIEFSAPRDLLGHGRDEPYLAKVYGPFWPYGRLHEIVRGYQGPGSAAAQAALSRSLLRHGKGREARHWLAKAQAQLKGDGIGEPGRPETEHAALLVALVDTREDADPEIPLLPSADIPPLPAEVVASLPPALAERVTREYAQVTAHFQARRYATAYRLVDAWPPSLPERLGPDVQLLVGFLRYKAEFYRDAIDDLKVLAADAALVARRPALLYYLGRSYFANAAYGKAIDALEDFVTAQRAVALPLLPASAGR
jgi:hypothetical protein